MTGKPQPTPAPIVTLTEEGIREAFRRNGANPYGPAAQDLLRRSNIETAEQKLAAENAQLRKELQAEEAKRRSPLLQDMAKRIQS